MGSTLALVLANLFMGHHEKIWLEEYRDSQILYYRRYVDDSFCLFNSERDADLFFNFINNQHPNIHFTMERESNQVLPFLDVLLNNKSPNSLSPPYTAKRRSNCLSFTPFCYKMGLVKTLIDRTFKINNTWLGFHNDIQNLFTIFPKNLYPDHVLDGLLHRYVTKAIVGNDTRPSTSVEKQELPKHYFKIPYIGHFSGVAQQRVRKLINRFCKPFDIKFVYSIFKVENLFNVKDALPDTLRTRIVYKFSCARYNACYVGETSRHFSTRVHEHLCSDRSYHASESCRTARNLGCFKILDLEVKLKESMYIKWEKPDLNQQVKHINLTLSL